MMNNNYSFRSSVMAFLALTTSAWAQAACYTVYNAKSEVVYRSVEPPVDMSKQLHQTQSQLPAGSQVVFSPNNSICVTEVNELQKGKGFKSTNANMVTDQLNLGSMITAQ